VYSSLWNHYYTDKTPNRIIFDSFNLNRVVLKVLIKSLLGKHQETTYVCTKQTLKVHLYLDEISSYVVIVCSGDRLFMLGNKLQTLQYFTLRPAEVWATHTKTHTETHIHLS